MHAYLITGTDLEEKQKETEKLAKKYKAKLLEFPMQNIKEARDLGVFLSRTPNSPTAILIKNIDQASLEAVNSFLKSLEERENYVFILTASTKYAVLPTILSRCQLVTPKANKKATDDTEITKFLDSTTAERLLLIENYRGREEARTFVNSLLISGRILLKKPSSKDRPGGNKPNLAKILSASLTTRKILSTNANPTLALTNFVISLDE